MKTKVVLWGENAKNEKVLIALELRAEANMVDVYTIPETAVNEEFSRKMMDEWRNDKPVDFPNETEKAERPLTITDGILPDDLKVDRTDVINRAQTEWHFMVLSNKLSKAYANELEDLKELVGKAEDFQEDTWDRLKEFWGKVQGQVQERNLFRGHADELRDETNKLFEAMKGMRKKLDEEFRGKSNDAMGSFMGMIEKVEEKAKGGGRLRPLFDELVELQRKYRESKDMTRDHRNKVWAKLDGAFKEIKGKLFGDQDNRNKNQSDSPAARTQRRLDGLLNAIEKMQRSMRRDEDDLEFQNRRIQNSDGQLETQIRQAKLKMIEERFNSKGEKLADMHKTKAELEERIVKESAREEKRKEQAAKDAERKAREAEAKAKIASEMKAQQEAIEVDEDKLKAAAAAISATKKPAKTKATEEVKAEPVATTAAAEKKAEPAKEDGLIALIDNAVVTAAAGIPADEVVVESAAAKEEETSILEEMGTMLSEAAEDAVDTAKAIASVVSTKVSEAVEELKSYDGAEEEGE
ncbi:MAG: hypothetical protein ACI85O_003318 [Saprospiraceae bacterium]|jgi:hypothetical protein